MAKKRRPKLPPPQTSPVAAVPAATPESGVPISLAQSSPASSSHAAPAHADVRHEPVVMRFRWALWTLVVALMVGVAQLAGVSAFFHERQEHSADINASQYPLAKQRSLALPAVPRLEQLDRVAGLRADVAANEQPPAESTSSPTDLNRLAPTSEDGYVQIPIDRAMELVVGRLKSREPPTDEAAAKDRGLIDGGESNSGRMLRGPSP